MEPTQIATTSQIVIFLLVVTVCALLALLITNFSFKKTKEQSSRAERAVNKLRNQLYSFHENQTIKYISVAQQEALENGWAEYRALAHLATRVSSDAETARVESEAAEIWAQIDTIAKQKWSAEEIEAEESTLQEQLEEIESTTASHRAELEDEHRKELAALAEQQNTELATLNEELNDERDKIARRLELLVRLKV